MRRAGGVARRAARVAVGLVVPLVALLPAAARACPVCFGNDAGPLTQGARAAAFVLLGLSALVLGGVAAFVLRLYRRQRAAVPDRTPEAPGVSSAAASSGGRP